MIATKGLVAMAWIKGGLPRGLPLRRDRNQGTGCDGVDKRGQEKLFIHEFAASPLAAKMVANGTPITAWL